tara:strand:+ start:248 stop:1207 length:960 start_codon:yes stop_codon:yes gene_type:complete
VLVERLAERLGAALDEILGIFAIPRSTYFFWKDQFRNGPARIRSDETADSVRDLQIEYDSAYRFITERFDSSSSIGLDRVFYLLQDSGKVAGTFADFLGSPPPSALGIESWRTKWQSDSAIFHGREYLDTTEWFVVTDRENSLFRRGSTFTGIVDSYSRFVISWHLGSNLYWERNRDSLIQNTIKRHGQAAPPLVANPPIDFKTLTRYDAMKELLAWNGFEHIRLFISGFPVRKVSVLPSHVTVNDGATYNEVWTVLEYLQIYHDWVHVSDTRPFVPRVIHEGLIAKVENARARVGKDESPPHEIWTANPLEFPEVHIE